MPINSHFPSGGIDTSDATAAAAHILAPYTAYLADGEKHVGTIQSMAGQEITPTTADQTIATVGKYLTGNITVKGDASLIPANILSGKSIFGVAGNVQKGKQYASGTISSSGGSYYLIEVNGLNFIPEMFFAIPDDLTSSFTIYCRLTNQLSNYGASGSIICYDPYKSPNFNIYPAEAPYYVDDTGVCVPVKETLKLYRWYAWE